MLTIRDHQSGDLFDPWEHLGPQRRRLLERSWAGVFREFLLQHLPVSELIPYFRDGMGRPSKDLFVAMGALVLQQMQDLTDQQTSEAVSLNIAWHYALDIRHEPDAYLCERTLRNYRSKVIELGLDKVLFRSLTDQLIAAVGVDTTKQRLDSTAIRSAIRSLTRLGVLVEAVSKFLRELKRQLPEQYASVESEVLRKYVERQGNGCFADTRPSESKRRLPEAAQDIYALLQQFKQSARELESFQLLTRIFDEQCEVVHGKEHAVVVRPPRTKDCSTVLSPADPDATYNKHKGAGYIVQIMETYVVDDNAAENTEPVKPDLITHVAVGKMTTHDKDAIGPALEDVEQRGIKPAEMLADSHYGSNESVEQGLQCGVEIVSPSMPAKGAKQGKLTLEDFELADDGRMLHCPAGHAPVETSIADVRLQVLFAKSVCDACPQQHRCPASSVGRSASRFQYTHDRVRQRRRRLADATDEFRDRYRWRAGVEATMSRFKHQMGMAKLRVRGMRSVTYTATLRALGLNILRTASYRSAVWAG